MHNEIPHPPPTLFAPLALLPEGWTPDVRLTLSSGRIAAVEPRATPRPGDQVLARKALLPAPANLHSHAFQRAMAGRAERRGTGPDSFWTWRGLMYRLLDRLTPEAVEAIAALAYAEMLEAGYAAVAEFHYLHHAPGGTLYTDPAELSRRIAAAAATTGIGLTLLPVFYAHAGADGAPLAGGQLRFGSDISSFPAFSEAARSALATLPPDTGFGIAPHSLRAATPAEIATLAAAFPDIPIHIHAAEQRAEVAEIGARYGRRPVALLLEVGLDARWCVIHATHMTAAETRALARSGAVAGLCPVTEANLGDGVFPAARFMTACGRIGFGTDSNVSIGLANEVSLLEYGQRLTRRARNVLAAPGASTGATLYGAALAGGAQALGRASGAIREGLWADLVTIDRDHAGLAPLPAETLLDGWVFAAGDRVVREVWSAGRPVVRDGRHIARDAIEAGYRAALGPILAEL